MIFQQFNLVPRMDVVSNVLHGTLNKRSTFATKDVPPYMIVAGIPAVPMRPRFEPRVADRLIELGWWDWPHARLRDALDDFRNLSAEEFLERYEGTI